MSGVKGDITAFASSLGRASCPLRLAGVNRTAVRRDGQAAVQAATRLQDYRDYLARARTFKPRAPEGASVIDREVHAQARASLEHVRTLSTSALRLVVTLHRGGALAPLAASWASAVQAAGTISATDAWGWVVGSEAGPRALREAGVDDTLLRGLDEAVRTLDARISADGSRLVVEGTSAGRPVREVLETAPRPAQPADVADLLTRGRLEAVAEAVQRGEPAYLDGVGLAGRDPRVEELVLFDALATLRTGVHHVRKLEDVGLPTYEGAEPTTIIAICLVAMAIGAIIMIAECPNDVDGGSTGEEPSSACMVGVFLSLIGIIGLLTGPKPPSTSTTNNWLLGSGVVHGTLRALASS